MLNQYVCINICTFMFNIASISYIILYIVQSALVGSLVGHAQGKALELEAEEQDQVCGPVLQGAKTRPSAVVSFEHRPLVAVLYSTE